jgi:photosystem II stability/assembly factor-like uncharacterized protein
VISRLLTFGLTVIGLQPAVRAGSTTTEPPNVAATRKAAVRVAVREMGPELGESSGDSGFVFHREDPRKIILPSYGRVFRSLNGGRSWSPIDLLTDLGPVTGATFVRQMDPANPNVLVATSTTDTAIHRSIDFGTTWTKQIEGFQVVDAAVGDPSSNLVLVLGSSAWDETADLWKTVDGGLTFEPLAASGLPRVIIDPETGEYLAYPEFNDIAATPANPNVVYVVQYLDLTGYYPPSVYKSVDGGEAFARLEAGPEGPRRVFPHPTQPDVLFVLGQGVHRSVDGGGSFERLEAGLPPGYSFNAIAFDALKPSWVYVAGIRGVFRSMNGGDTFQPLGLTAEQLDARIGGALHVSVDPSDSDVIYVNTTRGNFKSVNGGRTFRAINTGWRAGIVNHITFDNAGQPSLYLAMESVGIQKTSTRGKRYEEVPNTAGGYSATVIAVAPTDPDRILAGTEGGGLFRTTNGGRSWTPASVDTGLIGFAPADSEIAIDPIDPDNVYFAATTFPFERSGFYRSTDGGQSFQMTENFPGRPFVRLVAIDPLLPNVIYTGSEGSLQGPSRSFDGGVSFELTSMFGVVFSDIAVDPIDSRNVYLAGAFSLAGEFPPHSVVRSTDGGTTYAAADSGLPPKPFLSASVFGIAIDPRNPNRLYAWTRDGLFMTSDSATTWTLLEGDVTVKAAPWYGRRGSIAIHPKKPNLLYLAAERGFVLEVEIQR